jgi:hypothetical protein
MKVYLTDGNGRYLVGEAPQLTPRTLVHIADTNRRLVSPGLPFASVVVQGDPDEWQALAPGTDEAPIKDLVRGGPTL